MVDVSAHAVLAIIDVTAIRAAREASSLPDPVAGAASLEQVGNDVVGVFAPALQGRALLPKATQIIFSGHGLPSNDAR